MTVTTFAVQTTVVTGAGSIEQLGQQARNLGATRYAVVVDAGLLQAGVIDMVLQHLPSELSAVTIPVPADPDVILAEELISTALQAGCDGVIVIGGGSAMAVGKATGIKLANHIPLVDLDRATTTPNPPAPTIAIPTTAGSGSEVSKTLVLHQPGRTTDLAIRVEGSQPRVAILDGMLMRGLPRTPMLYSGLDAFSHCIESLWARRATKLTRAIAHDCVESIYRLLPIALAGAADGTNASGTNDAVLQELMEASTGANIACGNSGMGLVHGISSAPSIRLPHGLRNAVMLAHVAAFNAPELDAKAQAVLARIPAFFDAIGFSSTFADFDLAPDATEVMIAATVGHPFRANNIRPSSDEELRELITAAGAPTTAVFA
jgi:alcohol dehydrogenase class IV